MQGSGRTAGPGHAARQGPRSQPSRFTPARNPTVGEHRGRGRGAAVGVAERPDATQVEPPHAAQRREPRAHEAHVARAQFDRTRSRHGRGREPTGTSSPAPASSASSLPRHVDADDDGAVAGELGRLRAHERGRVEPSPGDISSTGWLSRGPRARPRWPTTPSPSNAAGLQGAPFRPGRLLRRAERDRRWSRAGRRRRGTRCGREREGPRPEVARQGSPSRKASVSVVRVKPTGAWPVVAGAEKDAPAVVAKTAGASRAVARRREVGIRRRRASPALSRGGGRCRFRPLRVVPTRTASAVSTFRRDAPARRGHDGGRDQTGERGDQREARRASATGTVSAMASRRTRRADRAEQRARARGRARRRSAR